MMIYKFSLPITAEGVRGERIVLGDIEGEVEIYGIKGQWFLGEIRIYDYASKKMIEVCGADKSFGQKCRRHLRTADQQMAIAVEWAAHVTMHGEDGLLDAAEMQFRHNYEAA